MSGSNNVALADTGSTAVTLNIGNNNANTTYSGILSGPGGLTKIGTGTLTLSGANTYAGNTTISAGTLKQGVANTIPNGSGKGDLTVNGTFDLDGLSATVNALNGTGTVDNTVAGTPTFTIGSNGDSGTFSGVIKNTAGTVALTKTGSGTEILSGANTFGGATTISAGVLQLGNASALQNSTVTPSADNDLTFGTSLTPFTLGGLSGSNNLALSDTGSNAVTIQVGNNNASTSYSGILSGPGALTKIGTGTLTLSGANTYTGATTINGGTLSISADNNLGGAAGTLALGGGTLNTTLTMPSTRGITLNTGTDTFNVKTGTTLTESGVIGGTGGLTMATGAGTLVLNNSSANTYTGGTALNAGTLQIAADNNLGASTGALTFAGGTLNTTASTSGTRGITLNTGTNTFNINNGTTLTESGVIGGTGGLTMGTGTGTLTLGGANTFTGATAVTTGKLALSGGSLSRTAITVSSGARFAPGAGTSAGLTGSGSGGATLNLNSGSFLDLNDGTIGNFTLNQQNSWLTSSTALTLGGETLNFDLGSSTADELLVNRGKASVTGTQIIDIDPLSGISGLTIGNYTLISLLGGSTTGSSNGTGLTGIFDFSNNTTSESLTVNGHNYNLSLTNSSGSEVLNVANGAPTTTVTTYNLSALAGGLSSINVHTGDTTAITSTITNAGTGTADTLNYSGLTAGTVGMSGGTTSGGPLAQNASGSNTGLSFTSGTGGSYTISPTVSSATNGTLPGNASAGINTAATVNVYNYAAPSVPTTVNLGAVRAGQAFGTAAFTISNTAPSTFSESLDASFGSTTTGGATTSGGPITVAAGGHDSTLTVGLAGNSIGGLQSGTVSVNLASDGAGTSNLGISNQTTQSVTVQGVGYRLASMQVANPNVILGNVFVGSNATQPITITNTAVADGYSENLDVTLSGQQYNETDNGGSVTHLAAGGTSTNIAVGIDTSSSGYNKPGLVQLIATSDTAGIAGDTLTSGTPVGQQQIYTTATVYDHASVATGGVINLGHILQGAPAVSFTYALTNAPAGTGPRDDASVSSASPDTLGYVSGFTPVADLEVGQSTPNFSGSFTPVYGSTNGHTFNITYGDFDTGYTGANVNNQTATLQVNAIVDPLLSISDASDAIAAGRSMLSGTPAPGNEYGSSDTHTLYVVREGANSYLAGGMTGINANKGYVNIQVTDDQGNPTTFTEGPVVALFNFGLTNGNMSQLVSLESDLTAFHYTWFDDLGRNGINGVAGTGNMDQLAFIPGYQLEVDLSMQGDPVLSFDFSNYDGGNLMVQSLAVVPEPTSMSLLGLGGLGLLARRRRKA